MEVLKPAFLKTRSFLIANCHFSQAIKTNGADCPGITGTSSKVLKAPVEATKNFDEEAALHNIQNNYNSAVVNAGLISKSFSLLQLIAEGFKPN